MNKSRIAVCVFMAVIHVVLTAASTQSCTACSCQINNIQLLDQLVEAKVNRILANEPSELSKHRYHRLRSMHELDNFNNTLLLIFLRLLQFCNFCAFG
jgi:hypothetical protein